MARLLIPTRNRPTSLFNVLRYLARFHNTTEVIVADGSHEHIQKANWTNVEDLKDSLSIDYRPYPADFPFFDRLLDVLRQESDDAFVMGADDDYPMMDVLDDAETFLREEPDYSTAMGALVHLKLESATEFTARFGVARAIELPSAWGRARLFAAWPFSTTYAVSRRDLLIERYERARRLFLPGFHDFAVGLHDCMLGKIKALPAIGFICTRNYNHSYLRPEEELIFLRRSDEVLNIVDQIRIDLEHYGGSEAEVAGQQSEKLIKRRLAELVGCRPYRLIGFHQGPNFNNGIVQRQYKLFHQLFEEDNPVRAAHVDKLEMISQFLRDSTQSEDNKGERNYYETLEQQLAQ